MPSCAAPNVGLYEFVNQMSLVNPQPRDSVYMEQRLTVTASWWTLSWPAMSPPRSGLRKRTATKAEPGRRAVSPAAPLAPGLMGGRGMGAP